jgi:diguanylate cyclase (GGDEF)-like protein
MKNFIKEHYHARATKQVYMDLAERSLPGVAFYLLVWLSFMFSAYHYFVTQDRREIIILLSAIITLAASFRAFLILLFKHYCGQKQSCNGVTLAAGVLVSGLAWGFSVAYIIVSNLFQEAVLPLIVASCGICAGGCGSLAPSRRFVTLFLSSMLIPMSTALFIAKFPFSNTLGVLCYLYFAAMFQVSNFQRKEYFKALNSQYDLQDHANKLAELSNRDPLTNLKNRRFFQDKMEEEFQRATRDHSVLSLIMIDIDFFKKINDQYGHPIGDECLKEMARVLKLRFNRSIDTLARVGGEEFAVILPHVAHESAMTLANNLRRQIEKVSIRVGDEVIHLTASLGIATVSPTNNSKMDDLFKQADMALYEAKRLGRNRVSCAPLKHLVRNDIQINREREDYITEHQSGSNE